jgi:competence ComEA-like helix-hairpin-helix protein
MPKCWNARTQCVYLLLAVLFLCMAQNVCAKKKPPLYPVNVNTSSSVQLQEVPGIEPSTADKILQARKSYGASKSVDDLQAIKGSGPKKLDKMRKYLTVGKPAPASAAGQNKKASSASAPPAKNHVTANNSSPKVASPPNPKSPTAGEEEEQ